jgi:hypothetical protein
MILITILALMALLLAVLVIFVTSVVGAAGIVIFGDVIVCIVFIVLLIRFIIRRRS